MAYFATNLACDLWFVSWVVAMLWSSRAAKRAPAKAENAHWLPTIAGFALLIVAGNVKSPLDPVVLAIWWLPGLWSPVIAWAMFVVCLTGLFFTWWARIHLGRLWSASITRKADHRVIDTGPYGIVRHPIYTGLIVAAAAVACQTGKPLGYAGVILIILGFTIKARLEERFLKQELGASAYDAYARRVPMLVPFWPGRAA